MLLPSSPFPFILLAGLVSAARFDIEGRRQHGRPLGKRAGISSLSDLSNIDYRTNITVAGQSFSVIIDTGSSDLTVTADALSGAVFAGKNATLSFAGGAPDPGPIVLAPVEFLGYTIPQQALVLVSPDADHSPGEGLIGLGPGSGSVILQTLLSNEAFTVLDNIFNQDTSTGNYITFLLERLNDPTDVFPGQLTVGEVLTDFAAITSQPQLPMTTVSMSEAPNQHFQILLDEDGFIGPDGKAIPITSRVSTSKNKAQATVIVDSGFSFPQIPASIAQAIYSQFGSDAELTTISGQGDFWIVACDREVNITLKFGGQLYPVHPLDTTMSDEALGGDDTDPTLLKSGKVACLGPFQPFSFDAGPDPTYDIIFGMAFLRNVYVLINFGDFVAGSNSKADPYIQLLSITDLAQAHTDFVNERLNGTDTTVSLYGPSGALELVATQNKNGTTGGTSRQTQIMIGLGVLDGVILLGLIVAIFACRKGRIAASPMAYRPLSLPAPGKA
ncbi:aspartic peptidase domain-containing protein [Roridomyces roridus]|uniref:Aspartic peptidase domain-containing protein n=1 Tax=Roridomyces roridus TaxID=1738132 RepID=A0AAD7C0R6_9AGAR|nr:aspartic peptidase domain-containing protein [Roridomyces roridus]